MTNWIFSSSYLLQHWGIFRSSWYISYWRCGLSFHWES